MNIASQVELENTREKLRRLQEHYDTRKRQPAQDPHLRAISLRSVKHIINQLKEEIIRFEAGSANGQERRGIQAPEELEYTKKKLAQMEEHYQCRKAETGEDTHARKLSLQSLKRTINQLKEEIVRYEAHAKLPK